jgi:glycogen operon protein
MDDQDWENAGTRALAVMLNGTESRMLILLNAHHEDIEFKLADSGETSWRLLIDSATGHADRRAREEAPGTVTVAYRSLQLLEQEL